jgi:hypothetical protein
MPNRRFGYIEGGPPDAPRNLSVHQAIEIETRRPFDVLLPGYTTTKLARLNCCSWNDASSVGLASSHCGLCTLGSSSDSWPAERE